MLPSYKSCFQVYNRISKFIIVFPSWLSPILVIINLNITDDDVTAVTHHVTDHCHLWHDMSQAMSPMWHWILVALQYIYAQKCFKDDSTNIKITLSLSLLFVHAKKHNQTQRFQSFLEGIFSTKFRENFKKFFR